jgi:hypothetical protein
MLRLTLRTLLAYIDDTLEPAQARELGEKVAASDDARELIEKIKRVTRRRGLKVPVPTGKDDTVSDANTVAEYLSDTLDAEGIEELEATCLKSDVHLAEVAACHQILTLVLTEPVRVPPRANQRMYKLVEPPASDPNRRPGRTVPVGGMPARHAEHPEHDDPDAPLLLGMRRYSASESWASRLGLVGAVAVLALLLVVAVMMALPHGRSEAPAPAREVATASTNQPVEPIKPGPAGAKPDQAVKPKPIEPNPVEPPLPEGVAPPPRLRPEPAVGAKPEKPEGQPEGKQEKVLVGEVPDPLPIREQVGRMVTGNVIVAARAPDAQAWQRVSPDGDPAVMTTDTILCLAGYKADVQLDTGVTVHLWGNIPPLLPDPGQPDARVRADVRIRFHPTPKDFDGHFTLLAGRVYLGTRKPGGARVRVRAGAEVWDVTLPDEKTEVLVEAVTGFVPGTPSTQGRGEGPRTDVRAAVVRGTASLRAPKRPKDFPTIAAPAVVGWNNKSGRLSDPEPIKPEDAPRYAKFPLIDARQGAELQALLNEMATKLTAKDGLKVMVAERLTGPLDSNPGLVTMALFAQAALLSVDPQPLGVRILIDRVRDQTRGIVRIAAIAAVSYWTAQAPGNSELLYRQMVDEAGFTGEDADLILRLLRGYMPPGPPRGEDLDALVGMLNNPALAIRELALWNLVAFADPEALRQYTINVAENEGAEYERFVRRWKARVEENKKGPPPPPKKK